MLHCLTFNFAAGLVIEGHGRQTVLRSPLWTPPNRPVSVIEFHRKDFPITLRNLVLDGRKHEQVDPGELDCNTWPHDGLRVWNQYGSCEQQGYWVHRRQP